MYKYEDLKPQLFTDEGQRMLLKIRDAAFRLLDKTGAVRFQELMDEAKVGGDSWLQIACVDRLVELGDLTEIVYPRSNTQYRIFVTVKM